MMVIVIPKLLLVMMMTMLERSDHQQQQEEEKSRRPVCHSSVTALHSTHSCTPVYQCCTVHTATQLMQLVRHTSVPLYQGKQQQVEFMYNTAQKSSDGAA